MNDNIERIIFPTNNRTESCKFSYDDIGLYSISIVKDAKETTLFIVSELYKLNKNPKQMTMMDATGGLGGNTISFCFAFKNVLSYEIEKFRFDMLSKNLSNYKFNNYRVYNNNCLENLNKEVDIYFFDPPWGGPEYKNVEKIRLKLDNKTLNQIIKDIRNIRKNAIISFKLPYNYDIEEFNKYKIKKYNIRNSLIILILS